MLQLLPPDDCRRLLDFFSDAGFTFAALSDGRKLSERVSKRHGTLKYLLEKTAEPTVFHTLVRWFTFGVSAPADAAAKLLPAWAIDLLIESGMLRRNADQLDPTVMLSPLATLLVASDPALRWEDHPDDLVLWPNPTTEQLFKLTIRKPFASVLDVGGGSGIQALGAASHSQTVVATDLNPRAAEFTAFNARLNGIANVECVTGDCFEPVQGRTFDLIVANPPFFITPSSGLLYCENTLELDLFCRRLAREAPRYLKEGGFFQMVCEWVEIENQPWRDRIAEWMESSGCDAWVILRYSMTPSIYGSERAQQRPPSTGPEGDRFLADWEAYSHEKKIAGIHGGLITMRKRSGQNWLRIEELSITLKAPVGDEILKGFEIRDLLDSSSDSDLMELRLRLAKDARLAQLMNQSDQSWNTQSLRLHLAGARPRQADIDPAVAEFIVRLNGVNRLGDLVRDLAERTAAPADKVERESIAVIRKLLAEGYLEV